MNTGDDRFNQVVEVLLCGQRHIAKISQHEKKPQTTKVLIVWKEAAIKRSTVLKER